MKLGPLVALVVAASCGGAPIVDRGASATALPFVLDPDVAPGREAYQCFQLDAGTARGRAIHAVRWKVPKATVLVHHAMMFASSKPATTPGPVPCEPRPNPVAVLPLYAPGGEVTALADGVSLAMPETAASFFLEMHLVRLAPGSARASVELVESAGPAEHVAGWVDDFATVPPLAPGATTTATATCRFPGPVHVVGAWPHMHRLGARFASTLIRANGAREPLLDVPAWDFDHQPLYALDAALDVGDAVETACTWTNTTSAVVHEGSFSADEMCNQGLVVWPLASAACLR